MNGNFPRILTLLRKERGISQKKAATELGISQSLLSHYEKGIRECGLDFLIRTSDYYGVSCDYLLGRSPDKNGSTISVSDIPEPDALGKENSTSGSIMPILNKKLIANSLNVVFDLAAKVENDDLIDEISSYLMLSVYKMFRIIYSINPKNHEGLFTLPKNTYTLYSSATQNLCEANAAAICTGSPVNGMDKISENNQIAITSELLEKDYPLFYSSLLNLVKNSEYKVKEEINMDKHSD